MVANTRATPGPGGLRPLNSPQPLRVEVDGSGAPLALALTGSRNGGAQVRHGPGRPRQAPSPEPKRQPSRSALSTNLSEERRGAAPHEWRRVREVLDTWRIDDEWWRKEPVSRLYYRVVLEDGTMTSLFKDLIGGQWRRQQA